MKAIDLEPRSDDAAELLAAMGNAKRLLILCHLLDSELSVRELAACVDLAQSPLSQHLSKLRLLRLVSARRDGQSLRYRLASKEVERLLLTLHGIYCAEDAADPIHPLEPKISMSIEQRVVCTGCGSANRLPVEREAKNARCGTCGAPLFSGRSSDVGGAAFNRQLTKSTVPVVVDVWAPWCGPCRAMAPEFEKAAQALEPRARFIKLNSDNEQHIASRLGIRGIPTMLLFREGKEVARVSGAMSAEQIGRWLGEQLGPKR